MEPENNMKVVNQDKPDYSNSEVHKLLINYFLEVRDRSYEFKDLKDLPEYAKKTADMLIEVTDKYTGLIEGLNKK